MDDISKFKKRYVRERKARKYAEEIGESKTRDIYRTNQELRRFNRQMEELVSERTKELVKTLDQALLDNRNKSELMADLSHGINGALTSILQISENLIGIVSDDIQRKQLKDIYMHGKSLFHTVHSILDFSKLEAGIMEIEKVPFSLQEILETTSSKFSHQAKDKHLKLINIFDEQIPHTILGDPSRIRQVIANLLDNAIKFTEEGKVTLSAKTTKHQNESFEILISVQDTGIGIGNDRLANLFDPFRHMRRTMASHTEGTGLSLAISKRLVDLMKGKIWVESELGKGSNFYFSFQNRAPVLKT